MRVSQMKALEMKQKWRSWAHSAKGVGTMALIGYRSGVETKQYYWTVKNFMALLNKSDTVFMNEVFCDLVDHARLSVPDNLEFDESWMVCERAFMWLEKPFAVPYPKEVHKGERQPMISAIGWEKMPEGGAYFMCYYDLTPHDDLGFACWSNFTLKPGQKLIDRILEFESENNNSIGTEKDVGTYEIQDKKVQLQHEMRWIYAAMHLMAQRMTHISHQRPSSLVKSMLKRHGKPTDDYSLRIVSLRRIEQERPPHQSDHQAREFNCQWAVRGHWREQWYPSEKVNRPVFIESYIKGPEGKPMKHLRETFYKAVR